LFVRKSLHSVFLFVDLLSHMCKWRETILVESTWWLKGSGEWKALHQDCLFLFLQHSVTSALCEENVGRVSCASFVLYWTFD
jgi:hypothetical protein